MQKFAGDLVAQAATSGMNHDADPASDAECLGELGLVHGDGLELNKVIPAADAPHGLDPPLAGSGTQLRLRIELDSFEAVADPRRVPLRPLSNNAFEAVFRDRGYGLVPAKRDALLDGLNDASTDPPVSQLFDVETALQEAHPAGDVVAGHHRDQRISGCDHGANRRAVSRVGIGHQYNRLDAGDGRRVPRLLKNRVVESSQDRLVGEDVDRDIAGDAVVVCPDLL